VRNTSLLFRWIGIPPDGANTQAVDPPELVNPIDPTGIPEPFRSIGELVTSASLLPE